MALTDDGKRVGRRQLFNPTEKGGRVHLFEMASVIAMHVLLSDTQHRRQVTIDHITDEALQHVESLMNALGKKDGD